MRTKPTVALGALGAIVLTLTGCSSLFPSKPLDLPDYEGPIRGISLAEVEENLDSIPGLELTDLSGGGEANGKGNTGYSVSFELQDGYRLAAPVSLVDYTLMSLWAVNDGEQPNSQIDITVRGPEGSELDLPAAAEFAGWVGAGGSGPGDSSKLIVELGDSKYGLINAEKLGTWPGYEPGLPLDVVVKEKD